MALSRCEPGSLKEALLFAAGSMLAGFPAFMLYSYFSVPPAHRTARMMQVDIVASLAVAGGIALVGSVAFRLAQARRRRQDLLFPRTLRPWLPPALGAAYLVALLAGLGLCQWLLPYGDITLLGCIIGLGVPVGLSRLAWRSVEPSSSLHPGA